MLSQDELARAMPSPVLLADGWQISGDGGGGRGCRRLRLVGGADA